MQLYRSTASPFARKVSVTVIETGQTEHVEFIDVVGTPTDPGSYPLAINPIGKIPTLVREDGPAMFDSRVICRYLDHRAGTKLYPEAQIWEVLTLEALADGLLDAAVLMVYERRCRPEEIVSEEWIAAQWSKVDRALDALESRWMSHLAGPLTSAQIGVGCALGYLDFRHPDRAWRVGRSALSAWDAAFSQRPSMMATQPS